jgi:lysophospholipase L1-like esterase
MNKILILIIITGLTFFYACEPDQPSAPQLNVTINELATSKVVAIGNSLTAGFQSSGLVEDFQLNSYPYLLAQQMGKTEFEQPLIGDPGIGSPAGMTPMYLDGEGNITQDPLEVNPLFLLKNALLSRPYDNLGVPGADLNDLLNTIDGSGGNPFFDLILRNPNLGNTTLLEQAVMLQPTMILLWAGSNDVLGAALDGGDSDQITSQADFATRMESVITQLRNDLPNRLIIMANIPHVTDIPYINSLDGVFLGGIPMVFDDTLQPVDFGGGTSLPLVMSETNVEHITLVGLLAYQEGLGIPDSAYMVDNLGIAQGQARQLEDGMMAAGLTPTGMPLDGTMTLTTSESATIKAAVDGFNQTIVSLATTYSIPVVNANAALTELNVNGIDGATGKFVLVDPASTAFSLDGVHANNAGNAIVANSFIDVINGVLQLDTPIPKIDVSTKLGQYIPGSSKMSLGKSISDVRKIFRHNQID